MTTHLLSIVAQIYRTLFVGLGKKIVAYVPSVFTSVDPYTLRQKSSLTRYARELLQSRPPPPLSGWGQTHSFPSHILLTRVVARQEFLR